MSVTAEYFLSGVNAIAITGEHVSCDASGSRAGAWPFAARNLILVSGVNKIVPSLQDALQRVMEYMLILWYIKEMEWRYNNRDKNLFDLLIKYMLGADN
jgi:hypothetical protein